MHAQHHNRYRARSHTQAGKSKGPMKLAVAVVQATPDGPKVVLSRVLVGGGRATGTPKGKGAHVALEVTKPRAITNK